MVFVVESPLASFDSYSSHSERGSFTDICLIKLFSSFAFACSLLWTASSDSSLPLSFWFMASLARLFTIISTIWLIGKFPMFSEVMKVSCQLAPARSSNRAPPSQLFPGLGRRAPAPNQRKCLASKGLAAVCGAKSQRPFPQIRARGRSAAWRETTIWSNLQT